MKIKPIQIANFRSFQDDTITLTRYTAFVGPNGAGKSNVLSALNVFFQEQASSKTNTARLTDEDYFDKNTAIPIRITVTFHDLTPEAEKALSHYVRQGELVVTAEAHFDPDAEIGLVHYFGQRLAMPEFVPFFEAVKQSAKAPELNAMYKSLQNQFPDLEMAGSKAAKEETLKAYEAGHPERCKLRKSATQFKG